MRGKPRKSIQIYILAPTKKAQLKEKGRKTEYSVNLYSLRNNTEWKEAILQEVKYDI